MSEHAQTPMFLGDVVPPGATFSIRATTPADSEWVRRMLRQYWASERILTRGRVVDAMSLPAFAAMHDQTPVGLLTYEVRGDQCEIVTHNAVAGSGGIGTCLLAAVRQAARAQGCRRLWAVTTNDNTDAVRFYQRRDFDIAAFHRDAITQARRLKPEIPDVGLGGVPIRHEIELEYLL